MKLELLVLLTYMHILRTTGDTDWELDLSLLDSVRVSFRSSPPLKDKIMCPAELRNRVEIMCNKVLNKSVEHKNKEPGCM